MGIIKIRDYKEDDASSIAIVFRDAYKTLAKRKKGQHPNELIDILVNASDKEIITAITHQYLVVVAEYIDSGEIIGTGAISNRKIDRFLKSTYSNHHYVKAKFQRGKAGVNVGALLRMATIQKAKDKKFRKIYGFSVPEAKNFHKKFNAQFIPKYNSVYLNKQVEQHYYEIILRKSIWNIFRLEIAYHFIISLYQKFISKIKRHNDKAPIIT